MKTGTETAAVARASLRQLIALNWRGLSIGVVTLTVALLVLALLSREEAGKNQAKLPDQSLPASHSDYYMEGVISRHYDQTGQLSHVLKSARIDHFLAEQRSLMQSPYIELMQANGTPWQVQAELAAASHSNDSLQLERNVQLQRTAVAGQAPLLMRTESLQVNLGARTAQTAQSVQFSSPAGQISATGLRADFASEQLELLANVKGHYEKAKP